MRMFFYFLLIYFSFCQNNPKDTCIQKVDEGYEATICVMLGESIADKRKTSSYSVEDFGIACLLYVQKRNECNKKRDF